MSKKLEEELQSDLDCGDPKRLSLSKLPSVANIVAGCWTAGGLSENEWELLSEANLMAGLLITNRSMVHLQNCLR